MTNKINFNKKFNTSNNNYKQNNNKPYYEEEVKDNNNQNNNQYNKQNNNNYKQKTKRELNLKDLDKRIVLWHKQKPLDIPTLILTLVSFLDVDIEEFLDRAIEIRNNFRNRK